MTTYYTVAKVAVNAAGEYQLVYMGDVPQQGGMQWGAGNIISADVETIMNYLGHILLTNKLQYSKLIESMETKNTLEDINVNT